MAKRQPEGLIKDACRKLAIANDLLFWNIEGKGVNGVMDTLCSKVCGGVILIEFKRPGKEPEQTQWKRIYEARQQGIDAWWTDSVEGYKALVGLGGERPPIVYPEGSEAWLT